MSLQQHTHNEETPFASEQGLKVIKREGHLIAFDADKIRVAITKAFLAVEGEEASHSERIHDITDALTNRVLANLKRRMPTNTLHIEDIQDQVELALMREGHQKIARAYVIYRENQAQKREEAKLRIIAERQDKNAIAVEITSDTGTRDGFLLSTLTTLIEEACAGLDSVDIEVVLEEAKRNLYNGMTEKEVYHALVHAARQLVEKDPAYSFVASRLLLADLYQEATTHVFDEKKAPTLTGMQDDYADYFKSYISTGIRAGMLSPELEKFDLDKISSALKPTRDLNFQYLGLQTLYDRYFLHENDIRYELPQAFFMRIAMGLALKEDKREERAIAFYNLISSFNFMCSTPTLFNAGTNRPQLSSCFLTTIGDDLSDIFKGIKDNALLAKYSGGLGNDWTPVRALGAHITGTNGKSQGVVPFLKVANDTAVAVNQGGKRKGAVCAYLETWHIDIEEFLDLRKNTGDERRRTHDMNTANWVPDLFMQRVEEDGEWTLFSPDETPDLHDLYGSAFKQAYEAYEDKARKGEITVSKTLPAKQLWRKMLTMLFETGHPWITFKDPCNIRSPQSHCGVVHSSNLCTEITLNTSADEVAVCNLGSINLAAHTTSQGLDMAKLKETVTTAMRMLDNVIDINYYTIPEAKNANQRHRPVGLGLMGFQDALVSLNIAYASEDAVRFADTSMEAISYFAIEASSDLAVERGSYSSFDGSLWSEGILPIDSLQKLGAERGSVLNTSATLDWDALREKVMKDGMRNSNTMAIAPTATISNICGVTQSIEPTYQNLFVKSNMSGNFTVVNTSLVEELKKQGLWDDVMISDLKYYDGVLAPIARIPEKLKALHATAFEIDYIWLVKAGAARQKWIDQSQSINFYMAQPSGKKLDELYRAAWRSGLKCTYYLRSMGASHVEKSTLNKTDGKLNAVAATDAPPAICAIDDPECEACQ